MTTTRVREEDRFGDGMRHEDHGRPGLLPDAQHLSVEALAGHLVERAERLVHEQERGFQSQRAGDRHTLLHATRQLVRVVPQELAELDQARASA